MMLPPSLEDRIPADYHLRRINEGLDLSFVHDRVRPLYCQDDGRPSIDPEVIIRLFLLQAITGTSSVRQLLREADLHLGYRWFIGYGASEALPDHSSLSLASGKWDADKVTDEFILSRLREINLIGAFKSKGCGKVKIKVDPKVK